MNFFSAKTHLFRSFWRECVSVDDAPGMADLVYFELGWAILSTICLANVLFGLSVVGIIGLSPVSSIPLVVSSAGAVANGLSYYVFYADYPVVNTAVASVFGDMMWMVSPPSTGPSPAGDGR